MAPDGREQPPRLLGSPAREQAGRRHQDHPGHVGAGQQDATAGPATKVNANPRPTSRRDSAIDLQSPVYVQGNGSTSRSTRENSGIAASAATSVRFRHDTIGIAAARG